MLRCGITNGTWNKPITFVTEGIVYYHSNLAQELTSFEARSISWGSSRLKLLFVSFHRLKGDSSGTRRYLRILDTLRNSHETLFNEGDGDITLPRSFWLPKHKGLVYIVVETLLILEKNYNTLRISFISLGGFFLDTPNDVP